MDFSLGIQVDLLPAGLNSKMFKEWDGWLIGSGGDRLKSIRGESVRLLNGVARQSKTKWISVGVLKKNSAPCDFD